MDDKEANQLLTERDWAKFSDARELIQDVFFMGCRSVRKEYEPMEKLLPQVEFLLKTGQCEDALKLLNLIQKGLSK